MRGSWPALGFDAVLALDACGSSESAAPAPPDCAAYCAAIQAACTSDDQQYEDEGSCKLACPAFPRGTGADTTGDTLGCRMHQVALAASGGAAAHCRNAGPGGDGTCGQNCDGYCDLAMTFCTAANNAEIYDDRAACLADCRARKTDSKYTTGPGVTSMGNQVACLIFHAVQASISPGMHCGPHLDPEFSVCQDAP
jgi:hypothetical protein